MPAQKEPPALATRAASNFDRLAKPIKPQFIPTLTQRQARRLRRRFDLLPATARTVAALVFMEARA